MRYPFQTIAGLRELTLCLRRTNVAFTSLLVPATFALAASLCEGLTLALLIPTMKAMSQADLSSLRDIPVLGQLVQPMVVEKRTTSLVLMLVAATFAAAVAKTSLVYLSTLYTARVIKGFGNALRKLVYDRYLDCGKLFFDRNNLGYLHQVLTSYVGVICSSLTTLQGALNAVMTLTIYLIIMAVISWKLTLLVACIFPLLHLSLRWLISRIARTSQMYSDSYNELGKKISNALSSMPLVKAYCAEDLERTWFGRISDQVQALEYSIEKKSQLVGPVQEIILLAVLFSLVALIAFFVTQDPTADLASYAVYLLTMKRAAVMFGVFNSIQAALASVHGPLQEVTKVLSEERRFAVPDGTIQAKGVSDSIQCKDLSFVYPDGIEALKRVNFSILSGKVTAIVGQSGAGKSTLMNLLMRYYDCPPGTIFVDGTDLRDLTIESWRSGIALVSQDAFLFHASLRFNLTYGLRREVRDEELWRVLGRARLRDYVAALPRQLDTEIGDRGVKLSGGEKQRVSIARAMLKGAELLLLDEATSSLDSRTETLIQEALSELMEGRTSVVIAHRLSTIKHADWVIVMEDGMIVEQGTVAELLAVPGSFAQYWQEQRM